jgi:hypothetical protein
MDKFCFILAYSNNDVIDFCKIDSERFQFLKSILSKENEILKENKKINLSKEKLRKKINTLLNDRLNTKNVIDFGNRFDEKYLYKTVAFDKNTFKLKTSGFDNLIIFGINIYNNIDNELTVRYSKYKKLPSNLNFPIQ